MLAAEGGKSMKKSKSLTGRTASKGFPNPIDVHVGHRLRSRRTMLGLSQTALAEEMGLTFQQIQKYESGANRISSSRLYDLCRILNVPIAYFFDEMVGDTSTKSPGQLLGAKPPAQEHPGNPLHKRETLELVRAYYGISNANQRKRLTELVRSLGSSEV
jgi:transcriptional regulator with XRE-family HTH domain